MLEFTHENLLNDDSPAGLTPRMASLVACCAQVARECVEAVEDGMDYFDDGGLRFAIVTELADLWPDGALSAFLSVTGDPLPETLYRLEGCDRQDYLHAHLLVLSVSDTSADYLLIPDDCLTSGWVQMMDDLHPAEESVAV